MIGKLAISLNEVTEAALAVIPHSQRVTIQR